METKILIVDDEENLCFTLERFLLAEGHEVVTAGDYDEAMVALNKADFDLIFADIVLKGKSGIDILRQVKKRTPQCPVVMITGVPTIETASEAVRLGAFDYLPKPVLQDAVLRIAKAALRHKALVEEKEKYRLNLEAIFKSVKDAIITVDKDLSIVEINDAAKDLCGFIRDEVIGKQLKSLPKQCCGQCIEVLEKTVHGKHSIKRHRLECKCNNRPGQVVDMSTYPLLNHQGAFSGGVLVIRDETRLTDLERNLRERHQLHNIIGKSARMQEIYSLIEDLADVKTTVLISGESGTGKELVADAIHYRSSVDDRPLVKVNVAALSENLLESELFGHVKGAFSGAVNNKIGRFQRADGGTIFLDEIGDMPARMQLRLLRVLQEMEFERVGDSTPIKVDVRILAATSKNLRKEIKLGRFRQDFYYRLKVVELNLPPLRNRREDIPLLVQHFLKKFNKKLNRKITTISDDVYKIFLEYTWPGNVRELEHALEHAFILCRQNTIEVDQLPVELRTFHLRNENTGDCQLVLQALENTHWNRTEAARLLGISRQSLYRKIKSCGICLN